MDIEEKLKEQIKENDILIYMKALHMNQDVVFQRELFKH